MTTLSTTLATHWAGSPNAHLGIAVAGFPNLFLMYGPDTNLGHSSIVYMLESQAAYLAAACARCGPRAWHRSTSVPKPKPPTTRGSMMPSAARCGIRGMLELVFGLPGPQLGDEADVLRGPFYAFWKLS